MYKSEIILYHNSHSTDNSEICNKDNQVGDPFLKNGHEHASRKYIEALKR